MLHKTTLALSLGSMALLMGGMLLANREIIPSRIGLALFALSGLIGMLAVIFSIAVLFRTQAFQVSMIGLLGALPMLVLIASVADAMRYPPINDISTDLEEPPAFVHAGTLPANAGRDMSFPEKWVAIIRKAYPDVQPKTIGRPTAQVFPIVLRLAQEQKGWEVTYQDEASGLIEAVATTRVLRFRDDVVIRVQPDGGNSRIDMRSKSREGRSDVGANAKRIRAFLAHLQ